MRSLEMRPDCRALQTSALLQLLDIVCDRTEDGLPERRNAISLQWDILVQETDFDCYLSHVFPMWRQRLWWKVFNPLLQHIRSDKGKPSASSLLCACSVIATAGESPLVNDIASYFEIILSAVTRAQSKLPLEDEALQLPLKCGAISALRALLQLNNGVATVSSQLSIVIPFLLEESSNVSHKAKTKAMALDCLLLLINLPYSSIFPLKAQVIRVLGRVVDDPKRATRQLAARVRNEWITLNN